MSYSYYPKKLYTAIFNNRAHPLRMLATIGALTAGPVYFVPEVVYNQPSAERTAVTGDAQFKNLNQSLTEVLALKQKSNDAVLQSRMAYQAVLARSDDKDAAALVQDMDNQKRDIDSRLYGKKNNFERALMLSEGISEKDALQLMVKYKTAIPEAFSSYRSISEVKRQAAHLDECQVKTFAEETSGNSAASAVQHCIDRSASRQGFNGGVAQMLTGFGGIVSLMAAFAMSGGIRQSVEVEQEQRRRNKFERKSLKVKPEDAPKKFEITVFRKK